MTIGPQRPPRNNSTSLRRALDILLHLGGEGAPARGATLGELADDLGMSKSTLLRLLAPLREVRLLEQDPDSGRYRLGWRTAQLGQAYLERLDLRDAAHEELTRLTAGSDETSHLVVPELPDVVYVDKVDSPQPVRMHSRIGSRQPAYCTAVGKALLAHSAAEQVDAVLAGGLPARTPNTHTTAAALRADLATIRRRGYAVDDIENEAGVRCVAAAVFDHTGAAVCAISVSGPSNRVSTARIGELGALVSAAAATISERLGARRPPGRPGPVPD